MKKNRFKVDDVIIIKTIKEMLVTSGVYRSPSTSTMTDDLLESNESLYPFNISTMGEYCGKMLTIERITSKNNTVRFKNNYYAWAPWMLKSPLKLKLKMLG